MRRLHNIRINSNRAYLYIDKGQNNGLFIYSCISCNCKWNRSNIKHLRLYIVYLLLFLIYYSFKLKLKSVFLYFKFVLIYFLHFISFL